MHDIRFSHIPSDIFFGMSHVCLQARSHIGYCPQYDALPDLLTPIELLFLFGRLRGVPSDELSDLVDILIQRLTLTAGKDKPYSTLSGGNKRKVAVALVCWSTLFCFICCVISYFYVVILFTSYCGYLRCLIICVMF